MDEALRCDRIALIHGGRILEIDPPHAIGGRYELPLIAVRGANRFGLLQTLRKFPHARSVYLFGDELHYTDERPGTSPQNIAGEVRDYLVSHGHSDAIAEPISAGIEDSFMALMGTAPAATAA
jgi:ABC-2 type transport system ATP-binding protein